MMAVTRTKTTKTASSQQVVATSTQSQMEQQNHDDQVSSSRQEAGYHGGVIETQGYSPGNTITGSLMPAGIPLNSEVDGYTVEGLPIYGSATDANSEKQEQRLLPNIPTADYIRRSSYKVGQKLLIRVVPTRTKTKHGLQIPELTFKAFSLQGIAETDSERYQLHETFEGEVLYLFGRRPRIWTMQGIVVNGRRALDPPEDVEETPQEKGNRLAKDMDYANRLLQSWEDYYRGSKSVELQARTFVSYEDSVQESTLLELTVVRNAQIPAAANVTITFVVHQRAFSGQEYTEGITSPNLADLIDKNNSGLFARDKIKPSDIARKSPGSTEIGRRETASNAKLLTNQNQTQASSTEKEALKAGVAQAQKDKDEALVLLDDANSDYETARDLNELDPTPDHKAEMDLANTKRKAAEAAVKDAESRQQAAQTLQPEVEENVSAAVSTEEDTRAERDVYTDTKERGVASEVNFSDEEAGAITVTDVTFSEEEAGTVATVSTVSFEDGEAEEIVMEVEVKTDDPFEEMDSEFNKILARIAKKYGDKYTNIRLGGYTLRDGIEVVSFTADTTEGTVKIVDVL